MKCYITRLYYSPIAEDIIEEPESDVLVPTTPILEPYIVIGYRLSECITIPKSAGVLYAGLYTYYIYYIYLYYNYLDLQY